MTTQKKLKQAIRARARKTGESYTAARRHLLASRAPKPAPVSPAIEPSAQSGPIKGAVSDATARAKTGHGLDHWFAVLDALGPGKRGHTDRAEHLHSVHGVPGWHAQGITVAYERARGLRQMNQSCTGGFQVTVSKTVAGSVAEVVAAIRDLHRRTAWLRPVDATLDAALEAAFGAAKPSVVKTKGDGYAWLRFKLEGRTVEIRITGKVDKEGGKGASVVADNKDLATPADVEARRSRWKRAWQALATFLRAE
jgi:hypothetical protein